MCDCVLCVGELLVSKNLHFPKRYYWYLFIWVYALNLLIVGNQSVNEAGNYFVFTWFPGMATALTVSQLAVWFTSSGRMPVSIATLLLYLAVSAGVTRAGSDCVDGETAVVFVVIIAVWTLCSEFDLYFWNRQSTEIQPTV